MKGVGDSSIQTHRPRYVVPTEGLAADVAYLAPPSLDDLLNPEDGYDNTSGDPFCTDDTEEVEDEQPDLFRVVRMGLSFAIEHYVDLGGQTVIRRYKEHTATAAPSAAASVTAPVGGGSPEEWSPDDLFK